MSYKIEDSCISCGACEAECQNQAIKEGETTYIIDPSRCTECVGISQTSRCTEVCPIDDCIVLDQNHKEDKAALLDKWKKLHPGEEPVAGTF